MRDAYKWKDVSAREIFNRTVRNLIQCGSDRECKVREGGEGGREGREREREREGERERERDRGRET